MTSQMSKRLVSGLSTRMTSPFFELKYDTDAKTKITNTMSHPGALIPFSKNEAESFIYNEAAREGHQK